MRLIQQALQSAADFSAAKRRKGKVPQRPTPVPNIPTRGKGPIKAQPQPPAPAAFPKRPKGAGGF